MSFLPEHGGGIQSARLHWPDFDGDWLDLSTGINPWAYPIPALSQDLWTRLPDRDLDDRLVAAARDHYGVSSAVGILPTPGSGVIIRTLPMIARGGRVAILGPTYSEHATAWAAAGHSVRQVAALSDAAGTDVTVVVNPNNPDGRLLSSQQLVDFASADRNRLLVVDQAFGDLYPDQSILREMPSNAVVLTSFGKFFGLAGLRLGLAFGGGGLLSALSDRLGPWPVSGPALHIGVQALSDRDWIARTRERLQAQADRLDRVLDAAGLDGIGGTPLFRLVRSDAAYDLCDRLGRRGILTRAFSYDPHWLRIGLPDGQESLDRLSTALASGR